MRELWREDFSSGTVAADELGGEWALVEGSCEGRGAHQDSNCFFLPQAGREIEGGTFESRVSVSKRLATGGWASAGLTLLAGNGNFWMLALTEGPKGERYVDFIESFEGRWQAQNEGETRLELVDQRGGSLTWTEDGRYRLRLELGDELISGTVLDEAGTLLWQRRYRFASAPAVRSGRSGLLLRGMQARYDDLAVNSALPLGIRSSKRTFESGPLGSLALVQSECQGDGWTTAGGKLAGELKQKGWGVNLLDGAAICDPAILHPSNVPLLLVTGARSYPHAAAGPLLRYLRHGGRVLFLGAPALSAPLEWIAGRWIDRAEYDRLLSDTRSERVLEDGGRRIGWSLAARTKESGASFEPVKDGADTVLRYDVKNLDGWAVYRSPELAGMFPENHDLLCFRVKGDVGTPAVAVELAERDGSRWMASVPLTANWESRVIPVESFEYWPDSPTHAERGGPGDRCHPPQVCRIAVGLIQSRNGVRGGPNGFWIGAIGTAKNPLGAFPVESEQPVIEGISPSYKLYPCRDIAAWRMAEGLDLGPLPKGELWSPAPRPGVEGFGGQRKWRHLPVAEALDGKGVRKGAPAWMLVNLEGERRGSMVGCVGVNDSEFFGSARGTALVERMTRRMGMPCVLAEGGADQFRASAGSTIHVGASVLPCGNWSGKVIVKTTVSSGAATLMERNEELELAPAVMRKLSHELRLDSKASGTLRVRVELSVTGHPGMVDSLEQELRIESPPAPVRTDDFVRVKNGEFVVGGKIWRINGVNYWPRYVAGMETVDYGRSWLSATSYDPRQIEEDLRLMNELGINLVSIQLGNLGDADRLRDFLKRCREHKIWVNGFLGFASPLAFNESGAREFVEAAGLRDEPALFAYDIIWEPGNHVFNDEGRKRWAGEWDAWVQERYGFPENAEKDWGFTLPRDAGRITAPTDKQMREDGPWRVMVAAYRRFMDDFTSRRWNDAARRLRAIDPNHLIGFRQGNTLPQDFALTGPVKHVDFVSPEGYAIHDLENGEDVAGFITRYVKLTSGGKPVYWSEFGRSVWDHGRMRADPALVEEQGRYNAMFHRMAVWSGAQGVAPWWWPGGYRVNEKSDFGILDADGAPRPSAKLFQEQGPALLAGAGSKTAPGEWLVVDRDAHPGGYWHIAFNEGWQACRRARQAGKLLGVRTAGTGTTSANAPLVAVGNVPCNGSNPPKYLNAEFNWLQVRDAEGNWRDVPQGEAAELPVKSGQPIKVRASVGNLGEAAWVTADETGTKDGAVFLSAQKSDRNLQIAIPAPTAALADADLGEFELPALAGKPREIILEMTALNRCWFGEKRKLVLVPR